MSPVIAFIFVFFSALLSFLITTLSFRAKGLSLQKLQNLEKEKLDLSEKNSAFASQIAVLEEKIAGKNNEIKRLSEEISFQNQENQALRQDFLSTKQTNSELVSKLEFCQNFSNDQKNEILRLLKSKEELQQSNSGLLAENKFLDEKLHSHKDEILSLQMTAKQEFQNLATKIFEEKSEKFTSLNKQNIAEILNPLNQDLASFKKKVEETYEKEARERVSLESTIKMLHEQTNKVSLEANNLASALKGQSKTQGNWGEMILESILEQSGLVRDLHYFKEQSFVDEEGKNWRPDFQIHLPEKRIIATDSKVSLVAYDKFCASNDAQESQKFLTQHIESIRSHVKILADKKYQNLPNAADFTLMFVPLEPAFILAVSSDKQLWSFAYERKVMMVSPTNLVLCLKIIDDLWKREAQSKNAQEIVKQGEGLYEKFVGFTESFLAIGKNLEGANESFEKAKGQLKSGRGNLVDQANKLKNLGLKSEKKIPTTLLEDGI